MDAKLRKRLLITIFIVAFVVIFVPMLFREQPDNEIDIKTMPPAPEQSGLEQKIQEPQIIPESSQTEEEEVAPTQESETPTSPTQEEQKVNQQEKAKNESTTNAINVIVDRVEIDQSAKQKVSKKKTNKGTDKSQKIATKKKTPTPVKHTATSTQTKRTHIPVIKKHIEKAKHHDQAWVVQLGSFSQEQHANLLIKQLRDKGFKAFGYRKMIKPKYIINRVYIGPFSKLDEAKKIREQLQVSMNIKGIIIKFDPIDID